MAFNVFRKVFTKIPYILLAALIAFVALSVAILVQNTAIIIRVFQSSELVLSAKFAFLGSMYGLLFTNFTVFSALYTVSIALLFGINSALLTYYIRRRQSQTIRSNTSGHTAGILGTVSGVFGVGCAACGSVIISGLLSLVGAGWLLALLPLRGAEFGLLGMILLSYSVYQLCKRINDPLVCAM